MNYGAIIKEIGRGAKGARDLDTAAAAALFGDILDGATWGADYLVLRMHPWTLPPGKDFPWPVAWPDMAACEAKAEAKLGAPFYRDDAITVFALKPAR